MDAKDKIILCPNCGEVEVYGYMEYVRRMLLFDKDGEPCGATEDMVTYSGKVPRCTCGSRVKLKVREGEKNEQD